MTACSNRMRNSFISHRVSRMACSPRATPSDGLPASSPSLPMTLLPAFGPSGKSKYTRRHKQTHQLTLCPPLRCCYPPSHPQGSPRPRLGSGPTHPHNQPCGRLPPTLTSTFNPNGHPRVSHSCLCLTPSPPPALAITPQSRVQLGCCFSSETSLEHSSYENPSVL